MEMMQMLPAGPPKAVPMLDTIPAAKGNELFRTLLNREQAEEIVKKAAEDSDSAELTGWLPPQWPEDTSERPQTTSAKENMANSWISSQTTGDTGLEEAGADSLRHSAMGLPGVPGFPSETPDLASGQAEGGDTIAASLPGHKGSQADMKDSGGVTPGAPQAGLAIASGLSGQLPVSASQPENPGRKGIVFPPSAQGLGILEKRFAEILRPLEAVSSSGGGRPFLHATTSSGESIFPAGVEAKAGTDPLWSDLASDSTGTKVLGDFPLNRETMHGNSQVAEHADLAVPGAAFAGRTPGPSSLPPATEVAAWKQPAGMPLAESQILDQVIGRIAVDRNTEVSRMSIRLQPEELGRIEIDLTVEQGRIKAQMVAQNQQVQEVLERHMPRLREALEQQGLKLDQIEVSVNDHGGEGSSHKDRQAESHQRSWHESHRQTSIVQREEPPPPAVGPLGKISLRI